MQQTIQEMFTFPEMCVYSKNNFCAKTFSNNMTKEFVTSWCQSMGTVPSLMMTAPANGWGRKIISTRDNDKPFIWEYYVMIVWLTLLSNSVICTRDMHDPPDWNPDNLWITFLSQMYEKAYSGLADNINNLSHAKSPLSFLWIAICPWLQHDRQGVN